MEQLIKDHLSLSDRIFFIIENEILSGSMKPGERIIETEVAANLRISKSPVREALKKLEGEGIVKLVPRKGYFVRSIDRKNIDDFFDIMLIIEPASARLSLKKKDKEICRKIDRLLDEMERELGGKNYDAYLKLNDEFHEMFHKLTENEWIIKIAHMLSRQAKMLRSLSLYTGDRFYGSMKEHNLIADFYKGGNEEALVESVMNHQLMFKENVLKSDFYEERHVSGSTPCSVHF
jgi:DNA-binding GntR family transcriptional regulator